MARKSKQRKKCIDNHKYVKEKNIYVADDNNFAKSMFAPYSLNKQRNSSEPSDSPTSPLQKFIKDVETDVAVRIFEQKKC